jgi:plastocyanin
MKKRHALTCRLAVLALVAVPVGVGCGGGSGSSTVTCKPSGTHLSITAQHNQFDKDCLASRAGQAVTISLDNKDGGVPHNIQIFTPGGASAFKGSTDTGVKTVTYHVPGLTPGRYTFHCDFHPDTMHGTFIVR